MNKFQSPSSFALPSSRPALREDGRILRLHDSGSVLVSVLALFMIVPILFISLSVFQNNSLHQQKVASNRLKAEVNARSGMNLAIAQLSANSEWGPQKKAYPVISGDPKEGTFKLEVADFAGTYLVKSTGIYRKSKFSIRERLGMQFEIVHRNFSPWIESLQNTTDSYLQQLTEPHASREIPGRVYRSGSLPNFKKTPSIFHWGSVTFEGGYPNSVLVIQGPGKILATGDIQVWEYVRLVNVELVSLGKIRIGEHAQVLQSVLYASEGIMCTDNCVVSADILSSGNIFIMDNTRVIPYSCVYQGPFSQAEKKKRKAVSINVKGDSVFTGTIISLADENKLAVKVDKNACIKGLVYTTGTITNDGKIFGKVFGSQVLEGKGAIREMAKILPVPVGIQGGLLPVVSGFPVSTK